MVMARDSLSPQPSSSCKPAALSRDSSSAFAASKRGVMPEPITMVRLSPATEVAIRLLPGNDRCVDCKAVCPQWAGVSFGVLLCLTCAGKHRSLGVQTSFVKSLVMDAWSESEVRALELGGNAKWIAVCAGTGVSDLSMEKKYSSSVAKAYKSRVALAAAKDPSVQCAFTATSFLSILAEVATREISPVSSVKENPVSSPTTAMAMQPMSDPADCNSVKGTTCCSMVSLTELNSHSKSCTVSASSIVEWRKYERKIGSPGEPLGFTLAKANSGYAEVSRIIPGGTAERANVIVGSLLIGLNDTKNLKFDEVVSMLRTLPRPISFHFVFRAQMASEGPKAVISSVPEPRTVEINVTLQDKEELGCSLAANEFSCVVQNVDEDCIARRHGVLVGSRVVAVNGQKYLKPKDLIREICTAQRPVKITVHRVEGLMRGWSR
ncbi:putative GTPase activating protein for Arf [Phytophthora infestans]|uniref:Putative GTPase activating protein for Arf n=1 Tax=Phytophthora infestans TaxID=4787 RepID=A0A833T3T2_PHYIN|nr:putative GTPase activating protein for Arf [Phytophthora infestans]